MGSARAWPSQAPARINISAKAMFLIIDTSRFKPDGVRLRRSSSVLRWIFAMFRTVFAATFLMSLSPAASTAGFVGAYIWGGTLTSRHASGSAERFYDSVDHALAAGFDTIRFKIGVGQVADYALGPDPCAERQSLACYGRVMFASPAWDNPRLRRVIITTIDFACDTYRHGNGNGCLVASQLTANAAAIQAEYADLYTVLKARFGTRPIQFIIDNWEGDNFAYCGDSGRFAANVNGFAKTCKASWPKGQTNQQRVQALLQWVGYKQAAATRFLSANPTFSLIVAAEFNIYTLFSVQCSRSGVCSAATDTLFDAIAAAGGLPYCSWSSYDSEGASRRRVPCRIPSDRQGLQEPFHR